MGASQQTTGRRWSAERLARSTLARQLPRVRGRGPAAVVEALRRVGPVQTQVPRAAHLALASRLPGVTRAAVTTAFESHDLVKATSLRGTVHTSTRDQHPWLAAVADHDRDLQLANHLGLRSPGAPSVREVTAEVEAHARGRWVARDDLVEHVRGWLADRAGEASLPATPYAESLVWGHAHLLRRPPDQAWERRTDTGRRTAEDVLGTDPSARPHEATAVRALVRTYLGAYGPASRLDVAWWLGGPLGRVDRAVAALGDELVGVRGPGGEVLLDLAEPPRGGHADPGTLLLPEFDGLLLCFHPQARTRFVDPVTFDERLRPVIARLSPVVLHDGRLVADWSLVRHGRTTVLRVQVFPRSTAPTTGALEPAVAAVSAALDVTVDDVEVVRSVSA